MKKTEKNKILIWASEKSDLELYEEYHASVYKCLGSEVERMIELGYDERDIVERDKYEKYLCERCDIIEDLCHKRGIELYPR